MNIAADITLDLADADEALTLYGRWAAYRESRRRAGGSTHPARHWPDAAGAAAARHARLTTRNGEQPLDAYAST